MLLKTPTLRSGGLKLFYSKQIRQKRQEKKRGQFVRAFFYAELNFKPADRLLKLV